MMTEPDDDEIILTPDELLFPEDISDIFLRKVGMKRRIEYVVQNYEGTRMTDAIRSRFSREIAEDLITDGPSTAHLYALERLNMGRHGEDRVWRDVLAWLDELGEDDARGTTGDTNLAGREGEHGELPEAHSANDAETTRPVSLHDGADGVGQ